MKTIKETLAITHNKVTIYVRIDYKNGKVDIVEPVVGTQSKFTLKKFAFGDRGLEYMPGWQNILSAIQNAITVATERLIAYKEAEDKEKTEFAIALVEEQLKTI